MQVVYLLVPSKFYHILRRLSLLENEMLKNINLSLKFMESDESFETNFYQKMSGCKHKFKNTRVPLFGNGSIFE